MRKVHSCVGFDSLGGAARWWVGTRGSEGWKRNHHYLTVVKLLRRRARVPAGRTQSMGLLMLT
jgi:hypothetical protein